MVFQVAGEVHPRRAIVYLEYHPDRKSTRLNSSHGYISYAVFCLKKKTYERRAWLRITPDNARVTHAHHTNQVDVSRLLVAPNPPTAVAGTPRPVTHTQSCSCPLP